MAWPIIIRYMWFELDCLVAVGVILRGLAGSEAAMEGVAERVSAAVRRIRGMKKPRQTFV